MPALIFRRLAFSLALLSPLVFIACSEIWTKPPSPYLGAAPPGQVPVFFAPDALKQLTPEAHNFDFFPDGRIVQVTVPMEVKGDTKIQASYCPKQDRSILPCFREARLVHQEGRPAPSLFPA